MQTVVLHPGTQHSRQTALALQELDRLAFLFTGLFDHPLSVPHRFADKLPAFLQTRLKRELGRFASPALDPARVRAMPRYELPERLATRAGFPDLGRSIDAVLNKAFGKRAARLAEAEGPFVLWGYDNSAFAAFADPRTRDCPKVLDRTIGDGRYWNEEIERIAATHGDWLVGGTPRWREERIARNDIEYAHADRIVCGSPFVADSVARYSPVEGLREKLVLLPYSFDRTLFAGAPEPQPVPPGEPVRFLFAGQVSARKGIQHLLEAIARLPSGAARLSVVGPVMVPPHMLAPFADRVDFLGPVPRSDMPAIMRRHHALVFPSHFEGSALVLIEAMASGLAIIQSAAAGLGASARSGIVLDRPDAALLEQAMSGLLQDRETLHAMRLAAMEESQERDFDAYRGRIAALLGQMGV